MKKNIFFFYISGILFHWKFRSFCCCRLLLMLLLLCGMRKNFWSRKISLFILIWDGISLSTCFSFSTACMTTTTTTTSYHAEGMLSEQGMLYRRETFCLFLCLANCRCAERKLRVKALPPPVGPLIYVFMFTEHVNNMHDEL